MNSQQQTPAEQTPASHEPPIAGAPEPKRRNFRWLVVIVAAIVLLGSGVAIGLANHHSNKPAAQAKTTASSTASAPSTSQTSQTPSTTNQWKGSVDPAALPLGDGNVATSPRVGYVDSCTTTFRGGGGAQHAGSWINTTNHTWNAATKIAVQGSVQWPTASYTDTPRGSSRVLATNDLPEFYTTGTFPISRTDPAYQYDSNPNHIAAQTLTYTLPVTPAAAATPNCLPLGPIGIVNDGVLLFNALDDGGHDAVAHETQDSCDGHPDGQEMYHYHNVPSCMRDKVTGSSTLVGYAFDGFGIYVERDSKGNLPTNADLDACHGRTSAVMWDGKLTTMYHYDATLEYPYTVGCFHGTSAVSRPQP